MREKGKKAGRCLAHMAETCLTKNGKLLLDFAEDNNLALLNPLFCTLKNGVSYTFQGANRSKGQARLDYTLTKQADFD